MQFPHYCDRVPEIDPVSSDYLIACHYFPGWNVYENGYSGFSRMTGFPDRTPLLGYYDEADPEVADWEVKWALEHGIGCFVYCWYRCQENVGHPLKKDGMYLEHQLDALKASRYGKQMKFAIMWECDNAGVASGKADLTDHLLPYWAEQYFRQPNYLMIDNKPVLFVYDYSFRVAEAFGGAAKTREALEACSEKAKQYGFDGVYFMVEYRYDKKSVLEEYKNTGYRHTFAYCWHSEEPSPEAKNPFPTQEEIIAKQLELMQSHLAFDPYFTILTASQSWDPYPWYRGTARVRSTPRWKLTPENWRILLEKVKTMADGMPDGAFGKRFIMLDNWNEWGEGHYIAPHVSGGFKYLQAVREVFTKRDNLPDYRLNIQLGMRDYGAKIDLKATKGKAKT
ncbi:MAG: glycoside hydrolase family 99-like domain-containing protein [Clostridia bacterium]|nr:glycoside hydrolase family 99-like domain-containing protein [Clostridia bacterium]